MKALSIHPQYVERICSGEKITEFRSWSTDYRGDVLICATKNGDSPIAGRAVCIVDLYDVTKTPFEGYAFLLRNLRFIQPIPVRGQQRFFNVDVKPEILSINYKKAAAFWGV